MRRTVYNGRLMQASQVRGRLRLAAKWACATSVERGRRLWRLGEAQAEYLTRCDGDAANELTKLHDKDGWTYFAYDANGNTVMEQAPDYTRYYDWDGRDMMVGVRSTEQGWTDNEIRYDGLASRAELMDSTGTSRYTWDGVRVLKLEDGDGDLMQRQVHGYAPIPSVGDIAQIESGGTEYVPVADQVGTLWRVLNSSASAANSYQYDAFGVSRSASETFSNPFRFAGKPLDADPALYYFIARQYIPRIGCFGSRDPSQRTWQLSTYAYVSARPLSFLDPRGLWWIFLPSLGYPYQGSHDQLTDVGRCGFSFGPETFKHLKSAGDIQDYPYLMGAHPEQHWDADSPTPADRWRCFARSWKYVADSVTLAYYYADQCRLGKPYSLSYGQSGVNTLGGALHTVQDFLPHHCITAAEHELYDADNPAKHPWAWLGSLAATCVFLLGYRMLLLAKGWTEEEIRCCVEMPYDLR